MLGSSFRCCCSQKLLSNQGVIGFGNNKIVCMCVRNTCDDKIYKKSCCKDIVQTDGRKVEVWPKSSTGKSAPGYRCDCPREQPATYDPYRIRVPEVMVPPLPPSNAKPMIGIAKLKAPCSIKAPPLGPPCLPPPPKPFPWKYLMYLAGFMATMGAIYRYYLYKDEQRRLAQSLSVWRPRRIMRSPYSEKDLPTCVPYLIIGGGTAGWAAYKAIMQRDKKAKVLIVTQEDSLPYIRPPMSKHMWWNDGPPDTKTLSYLVNDKRFSMYYEDCKHFMDPEVFKRKRTGPAVTLASGWKVLRVDAEDHVAYVQTLCGEQAIYYGRCLLAPGSKAKNLTIFKSAPKSVRDRVCTLRTIRDLEIAYRKVMESQHVVIIGGGCLGSELAWHIARIDKEVDQQPLDLTKPRMQLTHIIKDKGLLAGIVPEYLGEWAVERVRAEGVTVLPKTQVYDAFESSDKRVELTLSNGESLVADYVFVCVGADPRTDLAEPSFLEEDRENGGFLVNTELQARTHLYVAGDAASYYSQWKDTRLRSEHYLSAAELGEIAGANMTGEMNAFNMEPSFWFRLGESVQMQAVGDVGACMPTVGLYKQCTLEETEKKTSKPKTQTNEDHPCYKKTDEYLNRYKRGLVFYIRDETVVGMVFWNMPPIDDRREVVQEILRAKPTYKDVSMLADLLGFPETQCDYTKEEEAKKEDCTPITNRRYVYEEPKPPDNLRTEVARARQH